MLQEELSEPLQIDRLELYATHSAHASGEFYQFSILLCETEVQSLSTSFQANYGTGTPVTVFSLDTLSIEWSHSAPGWNGFDLETPFQYQGDRNLIIEFRYLGDDGHTVNARAAGLPAADRCLSAPHPSSASGSFMSFLTCMRIHYGSQSVHDATFGGIKTLFVL